MNLTTLPKTGIDYAIKAYGLSVEVKKENSSSAHWLEYY